VLRRRGELLITRPSRVCLRQLRRRPLQHRRRVCGPAPVDSDGRPDASATGCAPVRRRGGGHRLGHFGRAWRNGVTDVAIGSAGIRPIVDLRGRRTSSAGLSWRRRSVSSTRSPPPPSSSWARPPRCPCSGPGVDPSWFGEGSVVGDVVRSPAEDSFVERSGHGAGAETGRPIKAALDALPLAGVRPAWAASPPICRGARAARRREPADVRNRPSGRSRGEHSRRSTAEDRSLPTRLVNLGWQYTRLPSVERLTARSTWSTAPTTSSPRRAGQRAW